ncbi:MAG: topoisomerase DNA-binding C4 zinc finger domain-containing protein [Deltaproteobacteria bacterium]|nr:topoisomerase DNA-binding C4 zinc finger domain-containing protein [Deltaproteobacteria bacterium]MBW1920887.1 topoisomerase DNA-binding C4 zinc finger domain-containing protein [Deltaproteobacteria bacterium]MBW2046007.1 topoisomerase DNA-binding C4 zinc finger domain-containing protein [Deltaproteobacteria bacterium]RLB34027.1 MAG: hypothetical protein DRH11_07340 [Deltaproteobacteria bacterium]
MEMMTSQNEGSGRDIWELFNETLGHHIERLIGTRYGIAGLPLNFATISCLILVTERENEIASFSSDPPERLTSKGILEELTEIGLQPDKAIEIALQDMIQKGYFHVDDEGRFSTKKHAVSMAKLLDCVFPGMPGMNLLAYFVQTVEEVQSGRKDLEFGLNQFAQVLQQQGVPLKKGRGGPKESNSFELHFSQAEQSNRKVLRGREEVEAFQQESLISFESKVISLQEGLQNLEIKSMEELFSEQSRTPETLPVVEKEKENQEVNRPEDEKDEEQGLTSMNQGLLQTSATEEAELELHAGERIETEKTVELDLVVEEAVQTAQKESDVQVIAEKQDSGKADDLIERQIAAFGEELALQCPICKQGEIQSEKTSTGKTYYRCSRKDCNFISWGKPAHVVCPACNNPFLVETVTKDGDTILKCPRATCRYWQKSQGERLNAASQESFLNQQKAKKKAGYRRPRRRVVRRRVVRRKR